MLDGIMNRIGGGAPAMLHWPVTPPHVPRGCHFLPISLAQSGARRAPSSKTMALQRISSQKRQVEYID